ncbi:hypothetical protein [Cellulomonas citrea]|nr:hypothetical protein [Cellulomonas citrea]
MARAHDDVDEAAAVVWAKSWPYVGEVERWAAQREPLTSCRA